MTQIAHMRVESTAQVHLDLRVSLQGTVGKGFAGVTSPGLRRPFD